MTKALYSECPSYIIWTELYKICEKNIFRQEVIPLNPQSKCIKHVQAVFYSVK